ncbi:hypothetical protein CBI38_13800 [Rhodococcus oxybenzonivorans]|uniref:Uncharacterized protein n=1 Tax=Rhodococcus oxybenzonivorans TaxID=1990687 RepID=A0A2S2BV44_9NOCA|nr:hypothetical protein CBI38_13800 [Rhodococcus oxybenzonivorans]
MLHILPNRATTLTGLGHTVAPKGPALPAVLVREIVAPRTGRSTPPKTLADLAVAPASVVASRSS